MNILYLSSHAILEYDQVKLWTDLGYNVFSIGAYSDPRNPAVDLRPAIDAPYYSDLAALCHEQRVKHASQSADYPVIDWAKADLHQGVIHWADTIIVDCYPESWIALNWNRIREKRVIWRTIGQSGYETEVRMKRLHAEGLQIVRYSPAERRAYGQFDWFAGEDALIRFGKDPADWYGWTGENAVVGNLAQHDPTPHGRDQWLHWGWFEEATKGLPVSFAGPNSEKIGGLGALPYEEMRQYLRLIRVYLYTGTVPASYTLGLIEAMMTGVPVVSIGPDAFGQGPLFEGHEIAEHGDGGWRESSMAARVVLDSLLHHDERARAWSDYQHHRAVDLFGIDTIGRQWLDFLGSPSVVTWQGAEAVPA
jgi:hypothetical protein